MAAPVERSPISFDSATVESVISAMHEDVSAATVQLRLRYLQRLNFPPGAKAGRGKRAVYGLLEILKVVIAFEMLDMDMTPQRAAATLERSWSVLATCLAPAWLAVRLIADKDFKEVTKRVDELRRIVIVEPGALSGEDAGLTVGLLRPSAFGAAMEGPSAAFRKCMVIDIASVVTALDAALQSKPLALRRSEIDAAFERLGAAVHDGRLMSEWAPRDRG